MAKKTLAERIVDRSMPEPNSGCWLWLGCDHGAGYGVINVQGTQTFAHRASYMAFHGAIPAGRVICHRCDNRGCVNPDHLYAGTQLENMADCVRRGRTARLRGIDAGRLDPRPQYTIGSTFGISQAVVSRIKSRKAWAHLT